MIFCVEDDTSIRDLMLYTLNAAEKSGAKFNLLINVQQLIRFPKKRKQIVIYNVKICSIIKEEMLL